MDVEATCKVVEEPPTQVSPDVAPLVKVDCTPSHGWIDTKTPLIFWAVVGPGETCHE